jgi:hypothetical protein
MFFPGEIHGSLRECQQVDRRRGPRCAGFDEGGFEAEVESDPPLSAFDALAFFLASETANKVLKLTIPSGRREEVSITSFHRNICGTQFGSTTTLRTALDASK